jgi:D-alanine-D-alanine ligase
MKKIGVIFGGMSNEAEVSVMSARNVLAQLDRTKYEPIEIFWHKDGSFDLPIEQWSKTVDVVFPVTHGKYGEDGVLQGMLEALRMPYCGCRVLSSALCMDKAMFKALAAGAGISQTKYMVVDNGEKSIPDFPLPWFVKPANSGSSVGITKVESPDQLTDAMKAAREHDSKVLIEQGVQDAMEVEIAVLGNHELTVSVPGQVIPSREFYDYEDKYLAGTSSTKIPAPLGHSVAQRVQQLAEQAYRLADCRGFARVDFFVRGDDVLLSEINTIPGFTDISMYPKLMEAAGIPYPELLTRIIELAY